MTPARRDDVAFVAGVLAGVALLIALGLAAGCGAGDTDPAADSGPDAGATVGLEDGTYQVSWTGGEAGGWLDCDALTLQDDGRTLTWLGGSCREPALIASERGGACGVYEDASNEWWICAVDDGSSSLEGERRESGEVTATFTAERLQ